LAEGVSWQRCQFRYASNLLGAEGASRRKELAADLQGVFAAPNRESALGLASEAADRWRRSHPKVPHPILRYASKSVFSDTLGCLKSTPRFIRGEVPFLSLAEVL
jgi:hypothetical protein